MLAINVKENQCLRRACVLVCWRRYRLSVLQEHREAGYEKRLVELLVRMLEHADSLAYTEYTGFLAIPLQSSDVKFIDLERYWANYGYLDIWLQQNHRLGKCPLGSTALSCFPCSVRSFENAGALSWLWVAS